MFDPIEVTMARCHIKYEEVFTDFALVSKEGRRFPCHRVFLATQSPVMKAIMSHDVKEAELRLEQCEEVVEHFVGYFYRGKVPQEVMVKHLDSFLALADFYDVGALMLQTEQAAVTVLTCGNMLDMFVLSDLYRANKLREASELLIKRYKTNLKDQSLTGIPTNIFESILKLVC